MKKIVKKERSEVKKRWLKGGKWGRSVGLKGGGKERSRRGDTEEERRKEGGRAGDDM